MIVQMDFGYNWLELIHVSWVKLELRFQLFRILMRIIIANKKKMIDRAQSKSCSSSKVEGKERKKVKKKERWACRTNGWLPAAVAIRHTPSSLLPFLPIIPFSTFMIN